MIYFLFRWLLIQHLLSNPKHYIRSDHKYIFAMRFMTSTFRVLPNTAIIITQFIFRSPMQQHPVPTHYCSQVKDYRYHAKFQACRMRMQVFSCYNTPKEITKLSVAPVQNFNYSFVNLNAPPKHLPSVHVLVVLVVCLAE